MKITKNNVYGRTDVFEVVEKMPAGYVVWNIGDNMIPGYLPITMIKPGTFEIIPETLKAIALPDDELALMRKVVSRGLDDLKAAKRALKRGSKHISPENVARAVEIFERLSK